MLTVSDALLEQLHLHLALPLPMDELVERLAEGLGGSDAQGVVAGLREARLRRHRARTSWAQPMEQAARALQRAGGGPLRRWADPDAADALVARLADDGPMSTHRRRRHARRLRTVARHARTLRRGALLRQARSGFVASLSMEVLAACPWTAVATAVLPEILAGAPFLEERRWMTVPYRAQLLRRAKAPHACS